VSATTAGARRQTHPRLARLDRERDGTEACERQRSDRQHHDFRHASLEGAAPASLPRQRRSRSRRARMRRRPRTARQTMLNSVLTILLLNPAASPEDEAVATRTAALEALREKHRVPALGAARFTIDQIEALCVVGKRVVDGSSDDPDVAVQPDDLWHLGSCTKSMTATLLALLAERGDLRFEDPLTKLLPACAPTMDAAFRDLTLVELLAHRGGIAAMTGPDAMFVKYAVRSGTPHDLRKEFVAELLAAPPSHPPLGAIVYSNAGFVVAGHIAEAVAGRPWEELIRELLFEPLGMASAGFGAPGEPDELAAPRGHVDGNVVEPGPGSDNPAFLGPAGTVHASLGDWIKYLQLHLRGVKEDMKVGSITLRRSTFERMRTAWRAPAGTSAAPTAEDAAYGYGWLLPHRDWAEGDKLVLTHTGSNGMWYCCAWLDPAGGYGLIATANAGGEQAAAATDGAVAMLMRERRDSGGKRTQERQQH
jgi:CubicO group peptidase (beta-lactamase class C family)